MADTWKTPPPTKIKLNVAVDTLGAWDAELGMMATADDEISQP